MIYRKEIDGLRALAVVPVILFHANFPMFAGGYVGVDVFFVISGFLITSIILAEIEAKTFTVLGFYERRARRIMPALYFVMCCSIPFSWLWMPPAQLKSFTDSLVATALFCSNFLFWSESGYFTTAAAEKPLLHTWSLAIEEQFYLFFPLILSIFWFVGKRRLALGFGIVALTSFAASIWVLPFDSEAGFYLMPSRAWELLAGSILAFVERKRPLHTRLGILPAQLLSCLGLILLSYAVLAQDVGAPSTSLFTLLPVSATWILLAFATPETFVGRFLSHRWLVAIGLASYSAYLWHQPLFAFARLRETSVPSPLLFGLLIIAIGVLAYFSWRFVELPFRDRSRFKRKDIFAIAAVTTMSISTIGLIGSISQIGYLRFTKDQLAVLEPGRSTKTNCDWQMLLPKFPKIDVCYFGAKTGKPIVLWGDSHAVALLAAANESFKIADHSGWLIRNNYCESIVGIYNSRKFSFKKSGDCERSQSALLDFMRTLKPRAIVIAIRWTFQLFPVDGKIDELGFDNGEGGKEEENYRNYVVLDSANNLVNGADAKASTIRKFIASFATLGAPVLILYPVPEVGWNIPDINFKNLVSTGAFPAVISTSAFRYEQRNAYVTEVLDSLANKPGVVGIKVSEIFCNNFIAGRCVAQFEGVPLYFDDDHLSTEGARLVIAEILRNLRLTNQN